MKKINKFKPNAHGQVDLSHEKTAEISAVLGLTNVVELILEFDAEIYQTAGRTNCDADFAVEPEYYDRRKLTAIHIVTKLEKWEVGTDIPINSWVSGVIEELCEEEIYSAEAS